MPDEIGWNCVVNQLFNISVFGLRRNEVPSSEDARDMCVDTKFWFVVDPCQSDACNMSTYPRHLLQRFSIFRYTSVELSQYLTIRSQDIGHLSSYVPEISLLHPVHPSFLGSFVVIECVKRFRIGIHLEQSMRAS